MRPALHPASGFAPGFVADRLDEALALPSAMPVYGLGGLPGTGKSTLAAQMAALAKTRGLRVATLSIDDFYFGRRQRLVLARRVHSLLASRGPPGTHELPLALATLDALRRGEPIALPRFDKLADTRLPPSRWPRLADAPRLVVFEGWFLKTPPQRSEELATPINALERDDDPDGRWRRYSNDALADYTDLWRQLDWLTWLQPPGFAIVPDWRWQQERRLQAGRPQAPGMDRAGVARFMQLFERVGRQALRTLPALADRVIRLDAERRPLS
jgi:D-glycerate 3-kinase